MTERKIYLCVFTNGSIDSWSYVPTVGYVELREEDLPENYISEFGKKKFLFIDGNFVEREGWLQEWEEGVASARARLLEERPLLPTGE